MRKIDFGIIALVIVATPLTVQVPVRAETYMGIGYNYTINDVKAMFPGATFEDQKVAWAKPGEKLVCITGEGITGSIRIFFQDARPSYAETYSVGLTAYWRTIYEHRRKDAEPSKLTPEAEKQALESVARESRRKAEDFAAKQSDESGYRAKWVRWVPNAPIPLVRLKSKFGEKVRYSIDDESFSTWASWDSKGVSAPLSDDKKYASWVQFEFSQEEQRKGMEWSVRRMFDAISNAPRASASPSIPPTAPDAETSTTDGE